MRKPYALVSGIITHAQSAMSYKMPSVFLFFYLFKIFFVTILHANLCTHSRTHILICYSQATAFLPVITVHI